MRKARSRYAAATITSARAIFHSCGVMDRLLLIEDSLCLSANLSERHGQFGKPIKYRISTVSLFRFIPRKSIEIQEIPDERNAIRCPIREEVQQHGIFRVTRRKLFWKMESRRFFTGPAFP